MGVGDSVRWRVPARAAVGRGRVSESLARRAPPVSVSVSAPGRQLFSGGATGGLGGRRVAR